MKVYIVSTICNAHVIRWARALKEKGFDITVVSSEPNTWGVSDIPVVESLISPSRYRLLNFVKHIFRSYEIYTTVKRAKPDIIHFHSLDYVHPLIVGLLLKYSRHFRNSIISTWGTDIIGALDQKRNWWELSTKTYFLSNAKAVTATTKYLAAATAQFLPKNSTIHIIPFGIDCNKFKTRAKPDQNTLHIGFIKHLLPNYGPDYLVKAMAEVIRKHPDARLTMVGHGPMDSELKKMAIELDIENHVIFRGYVQNEHIPDILAQLDIFVMPTTCNEAFGVAALEAQAMEIPVVATKVGGIAEAVLDSVTGILVAPEDHNQLAAAIIDLAGDINKRGAMGKAGRIHVEKNFNLAENVVRLEHLYEENSD